MLNPVPVVLVTTQPEGGQPNIITVAWTGTICSEPPMLSVSMRKATFSYDILMGTREFVVNLPDVSLLRAVDYCGVVSGRTEDKFAKTGLTPIPATHVRAPIIAECPVSIECVVTEVRDLGLHTMFIAEVRAVHVTKALIDREGRFALERAGLIAFAHGDYYELGQRLGYFGFSVNKQGATQRPAPRSKPGMRKGPRGGRRE